MKARVLIAIAVIAAAFGAGASLAPGPGATAGVDADGQPQMKPFNGERDVAPFSLTDHRGQRFDRERLIGRWTLITFGFTSCPDACPTMLTNFAELRNSLVANWSGLEPQFVFVTVDPARDTQQALAQYVPSFDPAFLGATGTQAEIDRMHADLGGAHRIPAKAKTHTHADGKSHVHYNVDHSVLLYVINPDGRLHVQITPPFDPAGVAAQIGRFARDFASSRPASAPGKV
jgi:protein SCO1